MLLVIGDSISADPYGASDSDGFGPSYPRILNRLGIPTVSVALGGSNLTSWITEAVFRRVRTHRPDAWLIVLGANQFTGGGATTAAAAITHLGTLLSMIASFRASIGKTVHPVNVATCTPLGLSGAFEGHRLDFNTHVRGRTDTHCVDLGWLCDPDDTSLWPNEHRDDTPTPGAQSPWLLTGDWIHPSAFGHVELAKHIFFSARGISV